MTPIPPHFFEGIVTALDPISHSAGSNGITTEFRREKYLQPDGTSEMIAEISGNAMRGAVRRAGMIDMLERLGYGPGGNGLSMKAFELLTSGGSLEKGGRGLDIDFARKYRTLIPLLSVLGGASGNQMLDGRCKFGFVKPICRETAHLIHPIWVWRAWPQIRRATQQHFGKMTETEFCAVWCALTGKPWVEDRETDVDALDADQKLDLYLNLVEHYPSIHEMTSEVMGTRQDNEKNDKMRMFVDARVRQLVDDQRRQDALKKAERGNQGTGQHTQMMYYTETLAAGTKFYWYLELDGCCTTVEYEAFWAAMAAWAQSPYIGGKSGTGFGRVEVRFANWRSVDPRANMKMKSDALSCPFGSEYMRHLEQRGDEIREAINGIQ